MGDMFHGTGDTRAYLLSFGASPQAWSHSIFEGPGLAGPLWLCLCTAVSLLKDSV